MTNCDRLGPSLNLKKHWSETIRAACHRFLAHSFSKFRLVCQICPRPLFAEPFWRRFPILDRKYLTILKSRTRRHSLMVVMLNQIMICHSSQHGDLTLGHFPTLSFRDQYLRNSFSPKILSSFTWRERAYAATYLDNVPLMNVYTGMHTPSILANTATVYP